MQIIISLLKKRRLKKQKEHLLAKKYRNAYELAILNDDRKRMREIEEIIGRIPDLGGSRRMNQALYTCSNLRTYSGGKISPK